MTDVSASETYEFSRKVREGLSGEEFRQVKHLVIETENTVDASNTIAVTLGDYGFTTLIGVLGFKHTTDDSVVESENPTTVVASGVLTITVPAGSDDDKRIYMLYGI